jgi:hypothetical protein
MIAMQQATLCCVQVDGGVFKHERPRPVDYLVAKVRPKQLPDILLLLTWHAAHESEQAAADAAVALIEHDRKHLHVLHSKHPDAGSSGSSGGQAGAAADAVSTQGSSEVPRWYVKWWQKASKAAAQDQQQQLSQQESLELVEELLNVCVVYDAGQLCQAVAELPAAQQLGKLPPVLPMGLNQMSPYQGPAKLFGAVLGRFTGIWEDFEAHILPPFRHNRYH